MIHRGYRYALHPTAAQARVMAGWAGAVRLVYNLALEQRRDFWRQYRRATGKNISWASQSREVTALREEHDWLAAVPRCALEQALRDLERALGGFFAGRTGYPTPRRKFLNDTIRIQAVGISFRELNAKWSAVRLPRVGWVKFRRTRRFAGRVLSATISLSAGRWAISVATEADAASVAPSTTAVGIDRGIARTLTLSTGEHMQAPDTATITWRHKRAQRALARCRMGSGRRKIAKARVVALSARAARIRADWSHRASSDIARRFGMVAIEALNIPKMTARAIGTGVRQKAGLNRSILEQCWGSFARNLEYKLTERGGVLISVPAAYTSQTCACCGVVDARSRESQAVFRCVHCGHHDNAYVNAAKEILRRSTARLGAEGAYWAPVETPIMAAA